jgi:hypothetical protein
MEDPSSAPPAFIIACRSQGAFASFELPECGIRSMSLNTMKTHSDNNGKIIWENLNKLRKLLLVKYAQHVKKQNKPTRGSNAQLKEKLEEAESKLQQRHNNIIQFVDCYINLFTLCSEHAKMCSTFAAKLRRHQALYSNLEIPNYRPKLRIIEGGRNE